MKAFPIYSPEEEIQTNLFKKMNVRVFIKRDDMIHPFISGNKWRKLKYNVLAAAEQHKNHLVTFGGIWSNHLLATACAAAYYGLRATAFVRGEDIVSDSLFMYRLYGMNLRFTDRQAYRDKRDLFEKYFADDNDAYFVNEGGSGILGAQGCAEIIAELTNEYDAVFTAAGTGTTAAGLLQGIHEHQPNARLHVVPVLKGGEFLKQEVIDFSGGLSGFDMHTEYHFGGYARYNEELLAFISEFVSTTGILIDQVYTGKMLYALYDKIKNGYFPEGARILAVHTGGTFGILGIKEQLNQYLSDKQAQADSHIKAD